MPSGRQTPFTARLARALEEAATPVRPAAHPRAARPRHARQPAVSGTEHVPHRPTWDCQCCGKPWPCDPAREDLTQEGDSITRAIDLSIHLTVAIQDLTTTPTEELYERFLAWTWQATEF
jgi:hypothetical protein